ncbi:LAFA_0G03202g1_1 [Lachancea sp. 'fantastica']|nr:LAFA_0G03202g1_1 [Lachancea sp. 'fantastica']
MITTCRAATALSHHIWRYQCRRNTRTITNIENNFNISDSYTSVLEQANLKKSNIALHKSIKDYWKASRANKQINTVCEASNPINAIIHQSFPENRKANYNNSKIYRSFARWEVLRRINDTSNAAYFYSYLKGDDIRTDYKHSKDSEIMFSNLINDGLERYDMADTVDLLIWYGTNVKQPSIDMIDKALTSLAFSDPQNDEILLVKVLQLMDYLQAKTPRYNLSENHAIQIAAKAMSTANEPLLSKKVLEHVYNFPYNKSNAARNAQVMAAYKLIKEDYKKFNPAGVFYLWTTIREHYTSIEKHDSRILYRIIKLFTNQKAYRFRCKEIITKLNPHYYVNNPLLLQSIINFSAKTKDFTMAKKIMSDITSFATDTTKTTNLESRFMLSALLRLHLTFNDSKGVETVLTTIKGKTKGLLPADYQAIVSHLLRTGDSIDLIKAIKMTKSIKGIDALPSAAAIVNHITGPHYMNKKDSRGYPILKNILHYANKIDRTHSNKFWEILASIFVKTMASYKICSRQPKGDKNLQHKKIHSTETAELLKHIYTKSLRKKPNESTTDPFNTTNPESIVLKLTKTNKLVILRTIAKEARFANNIQLVRWTISEMINCGMPLKEVELDWNTMEKHQIRRYTYKDTKNLSQNIKHHGLKNFKRVIQ